MQVSIHSIRQSQTFYKEITLMQTLHFHNQIIFHQGESPPLYKLTLGSAVLTNTQNQAISIVQAPYYLNLMEHFYAIPAFKTVRACGKCQVQVVKKIKDYHRAGIKQWKEEGLRKSKFQLFLNIHSAFFYELVRLGNKFQIRHQQSLPCQQNHFYLIYSGSALISGSHQALKVVKVEEGEVIIGDGKGSIIAAPTAKFVEINLHAARALLCHQFHSIEKVLAEQRRLIESLQSRNQQLNEQLRRSRNKLFTKCSIPEQFVNRIEQKAIRFQKYCRAKSCFSSLKAKSRREVQSLNEERLREVMEMNRRNYKQRYISSNRVKGLKKVLSVSATTSPEHSDELQITQIPSRVTSEFRMNADKQIGHSIYLVNRLQRMGQGARPQLRKVGWGEGRKKSLFGAKKDST